MVRRRLARALGFLALTACLFVSALAAASRISCGRYTLLQALTHTYEEPGGMFQSLRRFREADKLGHVDVVFLGASHTYRGYDPRVFAAAGKSSMNLGSTAQTPLNTYYLAERYLPKLTPRVVVLDVFYSALSLDGLESTRDLSVNTRWSWQMQRMAFATENLGAISFEASKGLGFLQDESTATQTEMAGETYVPGGYCETVATRSQLLTAGELSFDIRPLQIDYLVKSTELAKASGARVVWISAPLPSDYTSRIKDRAALRAQIEAAAARAHVDWWDYSEHADLDPLMHFKDTLHLNAAGVALFDKEITERLASEKYFE